jgi:hypothetical protein
MDASAFVPVASASPSTDNGYLIRRRIIPVVRIVCDDGSGPGSGPGSGSGSSPAMCVDESPDVIVGPRFSDVIISSIASNNTTIGITPKVLVDLHSNNIASNKIRGFMKMFPYNNRQFGSKPIQGINYKYQVGQIYEIGSKSYSPDNTNSFSFCETLIDLDAINMDNKYSVYVLIEALGDVSYQVINHMFTEAFTDKIKIVQIITRKTILNMFPDGEFISSAGDTFNFKNQKIQSENDKPAIIRANGSQYWYDDGLLHRDNDLPAITHNGLCIWYNHGYRHRENDLPAFVSNTGETKWYKDGSLHRDNNMPAKITPKYIAYYSDGKYYKREINTVKKQIHKLTDIHNTYYVPYILTGGFLLSCFIIKCFKKL